MRKYRKLLALLGAIVLFAAACGGSDSDSESGSSTVESGGAGGDADCASDEVFCIGLVTDVGEVDDKSFNQSAWEGAQEAAKALGGQADYIESSDQKDYPNNIKQFVDQGYDAIVTVGFALGEETTKQAAANPDIAFIGVDQFQVDEVDNLAGLLTKTNKVGAVLGTDQVPPVVAFKEGWENGVKHTNPNAQLISTYHPPGDNAFTDPEWGATTAAQALAQGADIIFGAGGKTGNGALAEVAKQEGAYCVGVDTDQWETVPEAHDCLVTSAMKLITKGVADLLTEAEGGTMKGGNFLGEVGLAPYHDFDSKIPADVKAEVEEISKGVADGSIPTGYEPGG